MTTPQPAALLPCPHCGKTDTLKVISASEFWDDTEDAPYMHSESYGVFCDASRPDGPGGCGASSGFKETAQQAIETWNTRAALQPQPAEAGVSDAEIDALMPEPDGSAEHNRVKVDLGGGITGTEYDEVDAWSAPLVRQTVRAILALRPQSESEPFGYFRATPDGWEDCSKHDEGAKALYERPQAVPDELSPDFTDTARAALLWVLWHHQGGSSPVGQPIRYALGMGAHESLNAWQVSEAKRWAAITGSQTSEFHNMRSPQAVPMTDAGSPGLKRHAIEASDRLARYAAAPFFPETAKRGVVRQTTPEWWDGLAELIEEAQPLIARAQDEFKRAHHGITAPGAEGAGHE